MSSKISVVLSGYNQIAYLDGAIASVLSQTHADLELIIVDNGSTDGSRERLAQRPLDSRVRLLLHTANAPVTQRLNEAIAASTGDYVSVLYADDYYLPDKLERQLAAFSTLPSDYGVVYSPSYRLDERTGRRWIDKSLKRSGAVLTEMFRRHDSEGFINPISPLMRRQCFIDYPFHEDLFVEGEGIFLRFALTYRFHYLDEPLTVMREHSSNMGKAVKKNTAIALASLDKLTHERAFRPEFVRDMTVFRANLLGRCGWMGIRMAADPAWARSCLISAIGFQPAQLFRARTLAGLALSLLPAAAIRQFNSVMNAVRNHKETVAFRADYT